MAGEEAVAEGERHQERRPEAVAESKNNPLKILINDRLQLHQNTL